MATDTLQCRILAELDKYQLEGVEFVLKDPVATGSYGGVYKMKYKGMFIIEERLEILARLRSYIFVKVLWYALLHLKDNFISTAIFAGLLCAGKRVHDELLCSDPKLESYAVKTFVRECKILAKLKHPNIVQFLGVFYNTEENNPISSNMPYLIMEFLHMNVTQCIESDKYGNWPEELCLSVLHDVALGLRYLHEETKPILHRDLSSNNVMLTQDMTAKISDMGGAKLRSTKMTNMPGTADFMSPEAFGTDKYQESTDIYSFGVLILHLFTGEWPSRDKRHEQTQSLTSKPFHYKITKICLLSNPSKRPKVREIVNEIENEQCKHPHVEMRMLMIKKLIQYRDGETKREEQRDPHHDPNAEKSESQKMAEKLCTITATASYEAVRRSIASTMTLHCEREARQINTSH